MNVTAREDLIRKYADACRRNAVEMATMPASVIYQHFREFADELAALSQPEAEGWRTMDSAPTDRFILLYCSEDKSRWLAKWHGDVWHGVDDFGLTREGHSKGDARFVTGWFVDGWKDLPATPLTVEEDNG